MEIASFLRPISLVAPLSSVVHFFNSGALSNQLHSIILLASPTGSNCGQTSLVNRSSAKLIVS
jgi:hypothetical protein